MRQASLSQNSNRNVGRGQASFRSNRRELTLVRGSQSNPNPFVLSESPSDETLRTIVDACASNVAVLDESASLLYASKAWIAAQNNSLVTLIDDRSCNFDMCMRVANEVPGEGTDSTLSDDIRRLCDGTTEEFEGEYCYRGITQPIQFAVHAARLRVSSNCFRILIAFKELTPRDELSSTEQRLSQLLETTRIVVWEAEPETCRFTYVSDQVIRIFGYPISRWYEDGFLASHVHPDDREQALSFARKYSQVAQNDITFRIFARDGGIVWVHLLVNELQQKPRAKGLGGFMIDITEQKSTEETLRDLGGRLIAGQEEERSRVARELHDDLNQRLALLSIGLEQLGHEAQNSISLRKFSQELQKQVQELSADIHRLSYRLHPSKLDHLGLSAAVKSLCEELSRSGKLKVEVRQKAIPAMLPVDVTLSIFRIVQEALRNCTKHSGARAAQVVLEKTGSVIRLSVSDNGCGFDMKSKLMKKGLGFISMTERIRLLGGTINVYSQPQRGTRIEVSVPLKPETSSY
jgi:PAS domain S-box-containing protein